MPVTTTSSNGKRDPNATAGRPISDSQPFATSESLQSWSHGVAAVEARLMQLSVERDELEGELGRLPEGAGRTIDERRRKQHAEQRLDELNKSMSQARNQLKQAQRVHLVGA
jgi:septal ring factor EnvC (AmiA/AmiB activator)